MMKHSPLTAALIAMAIWSASASAQGRVMTLDEMFKIAEENNPQLVVSSSSVEEATAAVSSARTAMTPDIDINVSLSVIGNAWISDRDFSNGMNAETPHFGNTYSIAITQMLYAGGAIKRSIEIAGLQKEMAELAHVATRQGVRLMIAGYYLDLCKLANQKTILLKNIDQTQRLVDDIEANYSAGTALKSDITRYELQLQSLNLSLTQVENATNITTRYLNTALGLAPDAQTLPDTTVTSKNHDVASEEEWLKMSSKSPDVMIASKSTELAETAVSATRAGMRPSVALRVEDKLDGPITYEIPVLDKNVNFWYAGVNISYNLGCLYKQKRKVAESRIAVNTAQARLAQQTSKSEADTHAAYVKLQEAMTDHATHEKSVQLAHENYEVVHYRYLNGMALITDMLDASNQQLNAELQLANSDIDIVYRNIALKAVTGTL